MCYNEGKSRFSFVTTLGLKLFTLATITFIQRISLLSVCSVALFKRLPRTLYISFLKRSRGKALWWWLWRLFCRDARRSLVKTCLHRAKLKAAKANVAKANRLTRVRIRVAFSNCNFALRLIFLPFNFLFRSRAVWHEPECYYCKFIFPPAFHLVK